ncbi:MAG: alpha/beta hydrolase [Acidobacteriaceae bacterium]|nr:alpha/beta hydrolase [Acidobacteriaceae bacterium]
MRPTVRHFACYILFAFAAASLHAQAPTPTAPAALANYTTKSGIPYTQGAAGPLKADAYIPNGAGPFPAILFIHGGGWINGDRYQMIKLIKELANQGYLGFTIDYDVDPVHYPASFHESLAALRYMRDHAAELHLDPARIAVAGSSAGGELAALVALNPADVTVPASPAITSTTSTRVRAAIILNGVLDLTALGDKSHMVTEYLGGPCTSLPDVCKDASPLSHVHAGAPPFFVGHGTADATVPFPQAEAFVTALRASKVPVRFFTAKDGPHTYWQKPQFFADNLKDILGFLSLALRPAKPAPPANPAP